MHNIKCLINITNGISFSDNFNKCDALAVAMYDFNNNIFKRKNFCIFGLKGGCIVQVNPVIDRPLFRLSIQKSFKPNSRPVYLFFNSILKSLNIFLDDGDVFFMDARWGSPMVKTIQCVGSIPSGIQTVSSSPDTEIIALISGDNTLILMSGNFDLVGEVDLFDSDQGEQKMVNVGWGKKETQFHGSEGKEAAKKKITESLPNENVSLDDKKHYISWRGDSSLFAVNFWCPVLNYRKIKIFNKCGVLQCISEFLPGLEGAISWRPSGNLIALSQRLPNKNVICFMEKNGLRHGDFTLPVNIKVLKLAWNSESTILSALCVDEAVDHQCILLWTSCNYHWYLKQRVDIDKDVQLMFWDDVIGNLLHIMKEDGRYMAFQYIWTVDHSASLAENDLGVVAVIDGCDVKLSAFKKSVIPPPMCEATVTLPSPALQIMFAPFCPESTKSDLDPSPNDLCVYMSNKELAFIKGMETTPYLHKTMSLEWRSSGPPVETPATAIHWLWLTRDRLLCVLQSRLCYIELDHQKQKASTMKFIRLDPTPEDETVLTVSQEMGSSRALIQLQSGHLVVFHKGENKYSEGEIIYSYTYLPEPCTALCSVNSHTFARTHNSRLYVDHTLVADNVTSFFCLREFLIVTLSSHQLCVTSAASNFKVEEEDGRRVERGALLVVVAGHSVVLQMPRGNLETVQPRALTLVSAGRLLDECDYKAVAELLRRQRIDLNLCVDHNPTAFLLTVPRFVAQVRDPQWLSVFLAELSEQDVTRSMYSSQYKHLTERNPPLANKVERVCSALREAMTQTAEDREHYLQPILSSLVRVGRVGEAISLANTDHALNYLSLLMDTGRLYDEALAVYNLDKALKIAGKSLMDPKEYVAYLNELRDMEPAYMRFTIDKRLRKPQSALSNLAQCPDCYAECLQYVQDTGLYKLALQLFKENPDMTQKVCLVYGDYLQKQHNYQEAGLMYRRGGDCSKAMSALTRAGCWQQCLTLAAEQNLSETALKELQESLYSALRSHQRYKEASQLCSQLGWHEQAVENLVDAHDWVNAVYVCHCHQLERLIESNVKPALLDCQSRFLAELRAKEEKMDKYSARLAVVRERKANLGADHDGMSDIESDTSSLSSFRTSSTGTRTTRNTRKAQRKLWSLKEGNPREEQALLFNITEIVQTTERLTGDVHSLCLALADLGLDEEASNLHAAMTVRLQHVDNIRQKVWPASNVKKTGSDAEAIDPTSIDEQLRHPPSSCVVASWKLEMYT